MKKLVFILFLFLFLESRIQNPESIFAVSAGLNVIKYPGTAGSVPDSTLRNWMVFVPDSPDDLTNQAGAVGPNAVIRIHSAWTDIGKKMLASSDTVQNEAAKAWCSSVNNFARGKSQVYVEPFNEIDKDYERASPEGNLDLNLGITRAKRFISHLRSCLSSSITLTSPAFDPLNANTPLLISSFASDFDVISYHPYDEDHAKNYHSGALAGKRFIFTETGVVKNGRVVYDDCEFIKFYCGQNITEYWQSQSDIIAYVLFTESPGDYQGTAWKFTNKNVAKALKNDCSTILSCTDTTSPGAPVENQYYDDLIPNQNPDSGRALPPQGFNGNYEAPDPRSYSNVPANACSSQMTISEKFDPHKVGGSGPDSGSYNEYDVTEISNEVNGGGPYSNYGPRGSSIHYAKMFPLELRWHRPAWEITRDFTTYEEKAVGAVAHSMPYADRLYLRGRLIEDAARSLEAHPDKRQDVIPVDEQIAWACGESVTNLYPKPEDPDCRPITISEVAYFFSNRGDSTSYEIGENGVPVKVPFPQDAARIVQDYYHCPADNEFQCGYFKTYPDAKRIMGGSFEPLGSYDTYSLLVNAVNVVPRGSAAAVLEVDNVNPDGSIATAKTANVLPLSAPISSDQVGYATKMWQPYQGNSQTNTDSSRYCQNPSPNEPAQDTTSPFSIVAFFKNLLETIFGEPKTISRQVASRYNLPTNMTSNLNSDQSFLKLMTPYDTLQYYNSNSVKESSYVKGEDDKAKSMPQPGLKDAYLRNTFNNMLKPYDWTYAN